MLLFCFDRLSEAGCFGGKMPNKRVSDLPLWLQSLMQEASDPLSV